MLPVLLAAAAAIPRLYTGAMDVSGYTEVQPPQVDMRVSIASATTVPWIDANGWRYLRGLDRAFYKALPPGAAAVSAAEAYAYGVDAVIEPAPEDAAALESMQRFLASIDAPRLPVLANIGIIDDGSDDIGEALNLMSRRNLLYRVVAKPDPKLDLNIRVGSRNFPRSSLEDPNDFAARLREKVGDDRRLVRLFGSYTVIAHLTGNGSRVRLHLLNYGRRPARDLRVRVRGQYTDIRLAEAAEPTQHAADIAHDGAAVEFTVPNLVTYAVVDLQRSSSRTPP